MSIIVQDIVARPVLIVHEEDSLFDCLELMKDKGVRRLAVVNADKSLIGMLYNIVRTVDHQQKNEVKQRP